MCTLSIVPGGPNGPAADRQTLVARLVFNRDELRSRPAGLPPGIVRTAGRLVIQPIDVPTGGTWIAATDQRLVFALLNRYDPGVDAVRLWPASRGHVIGRLVGARSLQEVGALADSIGDLACGPFRLVCHDGRTVLEFANVNPRIVVCDERPLDRPMLFTSSGLGDDLVHRPRLELFGQLIAGSRDPLAGQSAFHRHAWPDDSARSVCMRRADARTVSISTVDLLSDGVRIMYQPLDTSSDGSARWIEVKAVDAQAKPALGAVGATCDGASKNSVADVIEQAQSES